MDELPENRFFRVIDFIRRSPEIVVLSVLVLVYMILANIYAYPATFNGTSFPTSGGSDPFYNYRAIIYTLQYHTWLIHDNLLNYPLGAINPRTPYFHFFIILVSFVLSPFVNIYNAATVTLLEFDAVFGALLILPVYLITKEVFGKRAGLVGALLYTMMPSNLSAGILSDGRMHTPELIFAFFGIYFFQKALNTFAKERIFDRLLHFRAYYSSLRKYLGDNRLGIIYVMLGGASLGGLALAWQGFAYLEAIIVIYIFVQLVLNLFMKRPTGYLIILAILYFGIGLALPAYYYVSLGNAHRWLIPPIYLALVTVGFGGVVGIVGRRPWIISISILAVISVIAFIGIDTFYHSFVSYLVSGSGYFVKTRVYQTIAEASSPQLGQYIGGFGAFQFIVGISGIAFIIYTYFKEKRDSTLFIIIFALISIYMSFAAARFNITAAPVYATLAAGLLIYFADMIHMKDLKDRKASVQMGIRRSVKGNIKALHVGFALLIVLTLVIPSGTAMMNAAVPANNATPINNEIYNSLPSFLRPLNYSANNGQYVGTYGLYITNDSQPLSQSLLWLGNQDKNLPIDKRPAYVSWWDYGFQEINQGKHPTVADDFQQGYQVAGQVLLAQNQSVIISLFLARDVQGSYVRNGTVTPQVYNALASWFGTTEANNITAYLANAKEYSYLIQKYPSVYGQYIQGIDAQNAYFALVSGQLSNYFSTSKIVNAYQQISQVTGFYIKYIGVTTYASSLMPLSGNNTGIFYAPAYLTDHLSYNYQGEIVPYTYYNVYATTSNQTYALNKLPNGVIPTGYNLKYTSAFYNTSIYRFLIGYPPSVVHESGGLPGITYGQNNMTLEPAWNMSHFIIEYYPVLYNPYTSYQTHPNSWKLISLQEGYKYEQEHKGTVLLFPPPDQIINIASPIVAYYPGASVSGRVTTSTGVPIAGAYATIYDQYGVPHQYTTTNSNGYYNLTGLPGNDTVIISTQTFSNFYLTGNKILSHFKVNVTMNQANRIPTSFNNTTGLPSYYISHNVQLNASKVSGTTNFEFQYIRHATKKNPGIRDTKILTGKIIYSNSTYDYSATTNITNGQYTFNDLPPYNYSVSIVTGGKTYANVSYSLVQPGSTVYNIYVTYDVVYASVSATQKEPSTGYTINAVSSAYTASNVTNASGSAILWLRPGTYSITAYSGNATSPSKVFSFPAWGLNTSLNFTPSISAKISGEISGASGPLNITFYEKGQLNNVLTIESGSSGTYSGSLPLGVYTVYVRSGNSAFIRTIDLESAMTLNIRLTSAYNVTMQSSIKGTKSYDQSFEVLSQNVLFETNLSGLHHYSMLLPAGQYQFASYALASGNLYSGITGRNVISSIGMQIQLSFNNNMTVSTFDRSNSTTFNSVSELSSGVVVLYYSGTPVFFAETINGTAALHYSKLDTSLLTVRDYSAGFHSRELSVSSNSVNIGLNPYLVNLTVILGGTQYNGTVKLSGQYTYTGKMVAGVAHFSARSGIYSISLGSTQMNVNFTNVVMTVPAMDNYTYVPSYLITYSVSVQGGTVKVFSPSGQKMNPAYLAGGNYTVYVTQGSQVYARYMHINQNVVLNPTYAQGFSLQLSNSLSLSGGHYTITSGNMVFNTSSSSFLVPAGTFNVSYGNTVTSRSGDYLITGQTKIYVSTASQAVNVTVARKEVFSLVQGDIIGGQTVTVYMYNTTGVLVNKTVSNGYNYSVGVPGGKYTLYALSANQNMSYLSTFTVSPFSNYSLDLPMKQAYRTYLHTSVLGSQVFLNVYIQSITTTLFVNSSRGYIVLPTGSYAFGAKQILSYSNYTGVSKKVTYQSNITTTVSKTTYVNMNLARVDIYSFNLTQVSKTQKAAPGSNVTYNFALTNTGNKYVNVTLGTGNGTWGMTFAKDYLALQPGQKANDSVTVNVSKYAKAGRDSVPISVTYANNKHFTGYVTVNVKKVYNYSVSQESVIATPNGLFFEVPVNITNSGNTPITIRVKVNSTLLGYYGWTSNVSLNGTNVSRVTVAFNQSETVYVVFYPVFQNQSSQLAGGNVTLTFTDPLGNTTTLSIPASYPSTPQVNPYPVGDNIIGNYTGNPYSNLITGIIIIAVAVVAGLLLSSARTRKRGGR